MPGDSVHLESVTVPGRALIHFYWCPFCSVQSYHSLPKQRNLKQGNKRRWGISYSLLHQKYSAIRLWKTGLFLSWLSSCVNYHLKLFSRHSKMSTNSLCFPFRRTALFLGRAALLGTTFPSPSFVARWCHVTSSFQWNMEEVISITSRLKSLSYEWSSSPPLPPPPPSEGRGLWDPGGGWRRKVEGVWVPASPHGSLPANQDPSLNCYMSEKLAFIMVHHWDMLCWLQWRALP